MQDAVRLFEVPTLCPSGPLRQIRFQELEQFHWTALEPLKIWCHRAKATLPVKNISFESSQVRLYNTITGILDCYQPVQRWSSRSRGNSVIGKFDLWNHIVCHTTITVMMITHWKSFCWTSGAMRSRRMPVNGRVKSNILTLSPVMCLPVCLSTYMSMKWVAYAVVNSTILEEET